MKDRAAMIKMLTEMINDAVEGGLWGDVADFSEKIAKLANEPNGRATEYFDTNCFGERV